MKSSLWIALSVTLLTFLSTAQAAETFAQCTDRSGRLIFVDQASTNIEININGSIFRSPATELQDLNNFVVSGFQPNAVSTPLGKKGIMISVDLNAGKGAIAENGLVEFLNCERGEGG